MTRYRNRKDPYTRDIYKYSIYPRTPKPREKGFRGLRPGDTVSLEIIDVDERGRGVAKFRGRTITVYGGATVGDKVKVRIERVSGESILARVVDWYP